MRIYFKFPDTLQGILPDCANKWATLWIMSLAVEEGEGTGEMMAVQAGGVWSSGETAAAGPVCQRLKGSEEDGRKLKGEKGDKDIRIGRNLEKCRCGPKINPKTFLRFFSTLVSVSTDRVPIMLICVWWDSLAGLVAMWGGGLDDPFKRLVPVCFRAPARNDRIPVSGH